MRARNHCWDNGVSPLLGFGDHDDEEGEPEDDVELVGEDFSNAAFGGEGRVKEEEDSPGEDMDFGEGEEAIDSRVLCKPCRPSAAEVDNHNTTHIPFRSWCEICVRGRAQDAGHKTGPKDVSGVPKGHDRLWVHQGRTGEKG